MLFEPAYIEHTVFSRAESTCLRYLIEIPLACSTFSNAQLVGGGNTGEVS